MSIHVRAKVTVDNNIENNKFWWNQLVKESIVLEKLASKF
jgi:hypothetical protein